jgi:hypothetical protein
VFDVTLYTPYIDSFSSRHSGLCPTINSRHYGLCPTMNSRYSGLCPKLSSRHSGLRPTPSGRHITADLLLAIPFTIMPSGTLSRVILTTVLSFRHTTMQWSSSLCTVHYVVRYEMTMTAEGTIIWCLQHWYLHVSGINKTCFLTYLLFFCNTL